MKSFYITLLVLGLAMTSRAQVTGVSLQAGGLTCSMCSKAVQNALQKVSFVDKVAVDIKTQQYNITFKDTSAVNFDALQKAVQDAGFSVVAFDVTARVHDLPLQKDHHLLIGRQYFHFLNATGKQVDGTIHFTVVDRSFTSAKNYKKYSGLTNMTCVQTGKTSACCIKDGLPDQTRVYHAII
jgi:copper chaperone CopZ